MRSACMGSRREARHAGTRQAITATAYPDPLIAKNAMNGAQTEKQGRASEVNVWATSPMLRSLRIFQTIHERVDHSAYAIVWNKVIHRKGKQCS